MKRITVFVVALWAIVGSAFVPLVARAQNPPEIIIEIRADIDGRSQLILSGDTAQWHHFDFAAPGRQLFTDFPTTINRVDWYPSWPDVPDAENRDCNCFSDVFAGVAPALPARPMEIDLQVLSVVRPDGPGVPAGTVTIVQFPAPENNFTIIVEFDDNPQPGSAFYDVRLRIRTLPVIDIKPGSYPNSINLGSRGVVPVAILTTENFAAADVDPATVLFAGAAPLRWVREDVDHDGDMDLLFHFKTQELQLSPSSTGATLTGNTFEGLDIQGADTVHIVP